jgi:hypothetical protein
LLPLTPLLWCPLVRSLPLATDGLSDLEIVFRGTDESTPRSATCDVWSLRPDGTIAKSASKTITVPPRFESPNGTVYPVVKMDFDGLINASASKGNYLMRCHIPQGVSIYSYYHSEVGDISGN